MRNKIIALILMLNQIVYAQDVILQNMDWRFIYTNPQYGYNYSPNVPWPVPQLIESSTPFSYDMYNSNIQFNSGMYDGEYMIDIQLLPWYTNPDLKLLTKTYDMELFLCKEVKRTNCNASQDLDWENG